MAPIQETLPLFDIQDEDIPAVLYQEDGCRPTWLLSPYPAGSWTVVGTGSQRNITISFDVYLPGGKRLSAYPNLYDGVKRVTYGVRTGPLARVSSGTVQQGVASNLICLCRWMISNDIYRFSELTHMDVHDYAEQAAFGMHSLLHVEAILNRHIEKCLARANFLDADSKLVRRRKARKVFPTFMAVNGNRQLFLQREQVMRDAGLEGIGFKGKNSATTQIFDSVSLLCQFNLSKSAKLRLKSASLDEIDEAPITDEHLRRFLMSFDYVFSHRRYLNDAMEVPPFPGTTPKALAVKFGARVGRTASIPVKQAIPMIERAARWVVDYAPTILRLKGRLDDLTDMDSNTAIARFQADLSNEVWPTLAKPAPFPILPGMHNKSPATANEIEEGASLEHGTTLTVAIRFLATACAVVIAAFSARRAAEIIGLKVGCIVRDATGRPSLNVFIHKTEQQYTLIPVPEIVAVATGVLETLSKRARELTGTPYLFQSNAPGTKTCLGLSSDQRPVFTLSQNLRKFGYFLDIPPLSDGTLWTFRPHQFRRFFAVLYIWIYEIGDWGALSHFLRHWDPEMTRRYATDNELGHIIATANREHTARILTNATFGTTGISGQYGERLKAVAQAMYDKMALQVQVVSERKFMQRISRFIERSGLTLHALPWAYCAQEKHDGVAGSFSCAPQSSKPNTSAATVSTCAECSFCIRADAFTPYLRSVKTMHESVAQHVGAPDVLRKASQTLCAEIDEYLTSVTGTNIREVSGV